VCVISLLFNRIWVVDLFFENLWRLDLELFVEYRRELCNCKAVYTEAFDELFATLLTVFTNKDRAVNIPTQLSIIIAIINELGRE
jgi:hypothetical protein